MTDTWGSDVPVSMPVPPDEMPEVDMEGFGFGVNGICHAITQSERDHLAIPFFGPGDG